MKELLFPGVIFGAWTVFSIVFIFFFKKHQTDNKKNQKSFWNNTYIFESIPPVFPTLGIFCTAYGITIGIWNFNTSTEQLQTSIQALLQGLRLAFIATMAGILGLIIFQKFVAIIQQQIDDSPNKPPKQTDEITALTNLSFAIENLKNENEKHFEKLRLAFTNELEKSVAVKLTTVNDTLLQLQEDQNKTAEKANENTDEIIKAMSSNNELIRKKFDEFSELLRKNNTEALVLVMKDATEKFNAQMSELINKLVQENFKELNKSVQSLNDWQKENKEEIKNLTENFQKTTKLFDIAATTLKEVAINTKSLTDDNSKLSQIVKELQRVMIEDGKFQEVIKKLTSTIDTLKDTTESFDETTVKLNEWVKTEKNFKDSALIIIAKLEEFRNLNGEVWDKYRREMQGAVSIIKDTSSRLSEDLENINGEFYERLNDTLTNLDQCIQRFMTGKRN